MDTHHDRPVTAGRGFEPHGAHPDLHVRSPGALCDRIRPPPTGTLSKYLWACQSARTRLVLRSSVCPVRCGGGQGRVRLECRRDVSLATDWGNGRSRSSCAARDWPRTRTSTRTQADRWEMLIAMRWTAGATERRRTYDPDGV